MDIYVYYRVPVAHANQLLPKVQRMQQQLSHQWSTVTALKRRPEEKDGCQTWMEVYAQATEGFLAALEAAVRDAGLMSTIDGDRHAEIFVDVLACA